MTAISVVIPTYNRAHLIGPTIDAILAQTRRPDEIIVVDDGSVDDTAGTLTPYGDRISLLRIPNSGDLVARNTGLRAAVGSLVAFCDSDDLWAPEFLATMAAQWEAEPRMVACYADFQVFSEGSETSSRSKFDDAPPGYWSSLRPTAPASGVFDRPRVEELLAFQPFFPSCMMVSRQAFLNLGGWDEGVSRLIGCDFATALRVVASFPIGVVRRPLVRIRKHGGNISGNTEKMNLGDAQVLDYVIQTRPALAALEPAFRASAAQRRRAALESAFTRHDFAAVRAISGVLPKTGSTFKQRIKIAIAHLPSPLGRAIAALVERRA